MNAALCPCGRRDRAGRPLAYAACCGRYLEDFDGTPAPDAESLMRSRYTAFVLRRADYLLATWHVQHRPEAFDLDAETKWLGLEVRASRRVDDSHAEVEFVARSRNISGRAMRMHERSRFVCEDGRWYYLNGELR